MLEPVVILNAKKLTWIFGLLAIASAVGAGYEINRIMQIQAFNDAILNAKSPKTDMQSFEAKFATAYWLAKSNGNGPDCEEWQGLEIERQWLAANICHATKEAAEAHSKAMLAVNAQAVAKAKEQA